MQENKSEQQIASVMLEIEDPQSTWIEGSHWTKTKDIYYWSISLLIKNIFEKISKYWFQHFIKKNSLGSTNSSFSQILTFLLDSGVLKFS